VGTLVLVSVLWCTGCPEGPNSGTWLWTSFLDQTKMSAGFQRPIISEIQQSLTFEDTPPGIPGAEDPQPEDVVAVLEEYRLGVGDSFEVRILDFIQTGQESVFTPTVTEAGLAHIPQLGWIHVEDMTIREVETEIRDLAYQKGIFREGGREPVIQILLLTQRQSVFNITGAVSTPGPYRIPEPDFRLTEALDLAGGLPESVQWIYVYRSQSRPKRKVPVELEQTPQETAAEGAPAAPPDRGPALPPVAPGGLSDLGSGRRLAQASPTTTAPEDVVPEKTAPPATAPTETESAEELIEAIAPSPSAPPPEPAGTEAQTQPTAPPIAPKFIFLNGEWVDVSQQPQRAETGPAAPTPAAPAPSPAPEQGVPGPEERVEPGKPPAPTPPSETQPVTWEEVATEDRERVIRIPVQPLRHGDSRYNIVIRHRDRIWVDPGPIGEFYMYGNVLRPGAYTLSGRQITLKQAIAAAGGLDALAWPSHCEITRRLDQDREQIIPVNLEQVFAGNQADLYVRPNDIVNVGTHIIAPFLATIRSSFRMSYGFGFVYDRNFADIDSFGGKVNPDTRRRGELQQRFPGLFP
jgi:polysaccharide export outer membrane protein